MYNRQQINFLLKFLFLFITFINLIKQESEAYKYIDYSCRSEVTCTEFVVDSKENPALPFYRYYSTLTYQSYTSPVAYIPYTANRLTLKFSIQYFLNNFYNTYQIFSPEIRILRILHRKNIYHQSSDDEFAHYGYC